MVTISVCCDIWTRNEHSMTFRFHFASAIDMAMGHVVGPYANTPQDMWMHYQNIIVASLTDSELRSWYTQEALKWEWGCECGCRWKWNVIDGGEWSFIRCLGELVWRNDVWSMKNINIGRRRFSNIHVLHLMEIFITFSIYF